MLSAIYAGSVFCLIITKLEVTLSESKKYGFIKLSRKVFENEFWLEERTFSRVEAWIDMIQLARWQHQSAGRQFIKSLGKYIEWQRGQIIGSIRFLSNRWRWSRGKVENYLDDLKKREMVTIDVSEGIQRITLINYERYNDLDYVANSVTEVKNEDIAEDSLNDKSKDNPQEIQVTDAYEVISGCKTELKTKAQSLDKTRTKTKQKELITKNKEEKIYIAEKVTLTQSEYEKLIERYGYKQTKRLVEKLNGYKLSHPHKKYSSDYGAIISWVVGAVMDDEIRSRKLKNEKNRSSHYRGKGAISEEQREELLNAYL